MAFAVNIENWRLVDGYVNYEVSSHGRIRNNQSGRILKNCIIGSGYYSVLLCKDGKMKRMMIHRLVCFAFCPQTFLIDKKKLKPEYAELPNYIKDIRQLICSSNNNSFKSNNSSLRSQ